MVQKVSNEYEVRTRVAVWVTQTIAAPDDVAACIEAFQRIEDGDVSLDDTQVGPEFMRDTVHKVAEDNREASDA